MGTTNKYMFQNESTKLTGLRPAHSISFCITTILRKHGSPSDPRKPVFSSWVCGTFCHPDVTYSREYLFVKWLIFPLFRCWTTCWYKPGEESAINDVGQLTLRPGTPLCVRLGGGVRHLASEWYAPTKNWKGLGFCPQFFEMAQIHILKIKPNKNKMQFPKLLGDIPTFHQDWRGRPPPVA